MTKILSNKSNIDLDYPVVRPSLDLDFTQEVLDSRITFSRGSIGTRVNRNRLIETVGVNVPRFDYDPVTGECRGLLIEESRINYELYSGDPTQWASNQNMTLTGNSVVLPDGTTSTNVEYRGTDSGANVKILRPSPSGAAVVAGETWTFSIFLRAGTEQTVSLNFQSNTGSDGVQSTFNMVTGQFSGSIGGANAANGSRGVQYVGNGWYRVWLTNTYQSIFSGQQTFVRLRTNTASMQMTTSFSAWGAQLEKGAFPTSYIPTTASTVTRSADNAQMTGTNFSSWYNSSEGTIYTQAKSIATISGATRRFLEFVNGSGTERYLLGYNTTSNARFLVTALGVNQADISVTASPSNGVKMCVSYATNNFSSAVNGTLGTRDVAGLVSNPIKITFGSDPFLNANTILSGTISRLTYYPRALKPNQLQYLTQ